VRELRTALGLPAQRVVVVPGADDVNLAACRAYFANCEADETAVEPPYWPKWRHFLSFLREVRADAGESQFHEEQPWDLITDPGLRTAVAAINSTMALSHRDEDRYGEVGLPQTRWFADRLSAVESDGWLRIGLINHAPAELRDGTQVSDLVNAHLDLVVAGRPGMRSGVLGRLITVTPGPGARDLSIETRDV